MDENNSEVNLSLSAESIGFLSTAQKWSMFIAIVGFVFSGLIAIMAFFMGFVFMGGDFGESPLPMLGEMMGVFVMIMYLLMAGLAFIQSLFTFNFSKKLKIAFENNDSFELSESFKNLKNLFVFMGVLVVIYLSAIVLGIIIAVGMSLFAAANSF